ncbi:MAG: hypothetical protein RLZZ175_1637 [Bacteroidota bacterium]|jgi:hypothetical protein
MSKRYLILVFGVIPFLMQSCFEPSKTFESKPIQNDSSETHNKDSVAETKTTQHILQNEYNKRFPEPEKSSSADKERVIQEMLSIIPEVNSLMRENDSLSKGETKLSFRTLEKPNVENSKFYILLEKVSKTEKIPLIHFYVNPSNLKIEIYDPTEDIIMDLSTWQKNGGN